jgi:protease-4
MMNYAPSSLPDEMVLVYAIKSDLIEVAGRPSLTQPLLRPATTLQDVVSALDLAGKDDRVKALVVKIENMKLSAAQIQELRDAIARFRTAGKRTYIYADSYGGYGGGMGDYYLASAFDEIWLQPVGMVSAGGVAAEVPFVRDLLDKIGVDTQFSHQGIYKSAPESLTERHMSAPHREMMESIISDMAGKIVEDIAEARGFFPEDMRKLVDASPYGERDALRLKLVDRVGYFDEMALTARRAASSPKKSAKESAADKTSGTDAVTANDAADQTAKSKDAAQENHAGDETAEAAAEGKEEDREKLAKDDDAEDEELSAENISLLGYSIIAEAQQTGKGMRGFLARMTRGQAPASELKKKDKIALIYGTGEIVPYGPGTHAAFGESSMEADKIVQAFRSVQADDGVAAVIFRIDSPGGSPEASETIRRAIMETRRKGKPVVVSMGSYAASGGYWISAPADKIVAQPGTLTGSIGVFGGKFVFARLWEKLGVNWDKVRAGENAQMWSSNVPFTEAQLQKFESLMAETYDAFLDRVAEGRNMPRDVVKSLAEGRVYTGRQAKENGLVDDLGGLDVALKHARALAKIEDDEDVPLVRFPPRKSTLEMFISLATEGAMFRPQFNISLRDMLAAAEEAAARENAALRAPTVILR